MMHDFFVCPGCDYEINSYEGHDCPPRPCERCVFIPTPDGKCICREAGE